MNSDRLWPEHIVAGFFHVVWIALAIMLFVGPDPSKILEGLSSISGGAALLLGSSVLGASFFVGALVNRVLADLSRLLGRPHTEAELLLILRHDAEIVRTLEIWWAAKSLFRSVMFANIPIIILALMLDMKTNSGKAAWAIILVGGFLEILTVAAFVLQRRNHNRLRDEILALPPRQE